MQMRVAGVVIFAAVLAGARLPARAELTVGIVDMARVFNEYPETRTADEAINKEVADYEVERKQMLEDFQKRRDEFDAARKDAANKAWSDEVRAGKEKALEPLYNALRDQEQKIRETATFREKQINEQRARMRQRILAKLQDIVAGFAKGKRLALVLDKSETSPSRVPAVIYSEDSMDITADILKITASPGKAPEVKK